MRPAPWTPGMPGTGGRGTPRGWAGGTPGTRRPPAPAEPVAGAGLHPATSTDSRHGLCWSREGCHLPRGVDVPSGKQLPAEQLARRTSWGRRDLIPPALRGNHGWPGLLSPLPALSGAETQEEQVDPRGRGLRDGSGFKSHRNTGKKGKSWTPPRLWFPVTVGRTRGLGTTLRLSPRWQPLRSGSPSSAGRLASGRCHVHGISQWPRGAWKTKPHQGRASPPASRLWRPGGPLLPSQHGDRRCQTWEPWLHRRRGPSLPGVGVWAVRLPPAWFGYLLSNYCPHCQKCPLIRSASSQNLSPRPSTFLFYGKEMIFSALLFFEQVKAHPPHCALCKCEAKFRVVRIQTSAIAASPNYSRPSDPVSSITAFQTFQRSSLLPPPPEDFSLKLVYVTCNFRLSRHPCLSTVYPKTSTMSWSLVYHKTPYA